MKLAPEVGLEPTTTRLTAACSTIELLWNPCLDSLRQPPVGALPLSRSGTQRAAQSTNRTAARQTLSARGVRVWQPGQKNVLRAACTMRLILQPHRRQGHPARSYTQIG